MRLIDADKYKEDLWAGHEYLDEDTLLTATNILDSQPTIEAEPVRHGEWRIFRDGCVLLAECSECGTVQSGVAAAQWDYCPMCGAKMDGDDRDKA